MDRSILRAIVKGLRKSWQAEEPETLGWAVEIYVIGKCEKREEGLS
jgi:hypothetical protein